MIASIGSPLLHALDQALALGFIAIVVSKVYLLIWIFVQVIEEPTDIIEAGVLPAIPRDDASIGLVHRIGMSCRYDGLEIRRIGE